MMKQFMDKDFLLETETAKKLFHTYAEPMPVIDYHCHIEAKEIAEDIRFDNITQVWLGGDHYKWRLMRANGVDEKYITGDAPDREKFQKWAETLPRAVGNPLYQWSHLELQRYFDYYGVLNGDTAEEVWQLCNAKLQQPDMSARGMIEKAHVTHLCTTDDPADSLEWHQKLREDKTFTVQVLPAWRPEVAMKIRDKGFSAYIKRLSAAAGERIDSFADLKKAVSEGRKEVDVNALDVYSHASVRADDPSLVLQASDLNSLLDTAVTYTLYDGSKAVFDKKLIRAFIVSDEEEKGWYDFDENAASEGCRTFIHGLAEKYNYTYDYVTFHTTWAGDLDIPCAESGRVIDEETESQTLYSLLVNRQSGSRTPVYSLERDADGTFGGTYVEVDIGSQHVWYYRDGDMWWESDCVSGKESDPDRRTPRGVYEIYTKERNRTLKGEINPATGKPSYESFVNFWMPFNEGIGLHDASWRSSFGGNIYYDSGSHGCINLPYASAQSLYDILEVGTPVIVH